MITCFITFFFANAASRYRIYTAYSQYARGAHRTRSKSPHSAITPSSQKNSRCKRLMTFYVHVKKDRCDMALWAMVLHTVRRQSV